MKDIKKIGVWTVVVLLVFSSISYTFAAGPEVGIAPVLANCADVNYGSNCLEKFVVVNYNAIIKLDVADVAAGDAVAIFSKFESIENPSNTFISGTMTYSRATDIITNMQYGPVLLTEKESIDLKGAFGTVFVASKTPTVEKELRAVYDSTTKTYVVEQKTSSKTTILGYTFGEDKWEVRPGITEKTLETDAAAAKIINDKAKTSDELKSTITPMLSSLPDQLNNNILPGGAQGSTTIFLLDSSACG